MFMLYIYICFIFAYFTFAICTLHKRLLYPLFNRNRRFPIPNWTYPGSAWTSFGGKVRPQALDDAISSEAPFPLWGLFVSITGYVLYAVFVDLQKEWPTVGEIKERWREHQSRGAIPDVNDIEPHSEELPVSTPSAQSGEQNVKFVDTHPGFMQETPGDIDHVRDAPLAGDATLDEFFSRPLRIQSIDWAVNGTLFQSFNPWKLYFENPRVINRIANYKLMRAKLHLKFTLNGNAFHYGRAICAYNPLPLDDTMTVDRAFLDADLVAASQRPHVYLDPTNSQGGEMRLPFFTYKNVLDIVGEDWRNLGEVVVHSMQKLKHANGATDFVTVNVFAWAEDVKFAIPTGFDPGSIVPQADEYGMRPISRIAGAVANAAAYLTEIPSIGPFARATEMGAQAVGIMASLLGYSSPVMLESSLYRPVTTYNIATTNQTNESAKLTVDCKQELTLDPRTVGLEGSDEMSIKYISQRESWVAKFLWPIGTSQETLLWNHAVDPGIHYIQGEELHLPAVCFASVPFKYWRGTLNYRFQFVCSKYHKGRVKIVYDPTGTPLGGTAEYNTAYTTIVDISDNADFEISVGWGQADPYREHFLPGIAVQGEMWSTDPLAITTPASSVGNGTLSMYVVNELTVPNSTIDNDIEVNVFISAGDDFELAVPDSTILEKLRYRSETVTSAPSDFSPTRMEVEPHAGESEEQVDESKPSNVTSLNRAALGVPKMDETNLIYFGESIHSFRQLIKRYCRHGLISGANYSQDNVLRLSSHRYALPYQAGYCDPLAPIGDGVVFDLGGTARYAYGYTTLLNYLVPAYGGWRGGVRWMIDSTQFADCSSVLSTIVTRAVNALGCFDKWKELYIATYTADGQASMMNDRSETSRTFDGQLFQSSIVNPVVMFEVPYYKNQRFTPAKRHDIPSLADNLQPGWFYETTMSTTSWLSTKFASTFCAAAEDFNTFFFLGAPIMYYEDAAPKPEVPTGDRHPLKLNVV